ncbi:MAG: DNA mismatch repair endonuclease MutL, partial [Bacilli bacterium]
MAHIKVMSQDLISKIAAGEVIENQASVIKELIENSIDAQATTININLIESGFQLIQVVDNGIGMSKEDLLLCIKAHATSKLQSEYDLFNIKSLGFRGEAMASIVAIAKVKISSNQQNEGYNLVIENQVEKLTKGYGNQGSKISVYNLFYNVPARLKYLKSQNSELANIIDLVCKSALNYP